MDQHLLTIILLTPLAGLLVLLFIPGKSKDLIRVWANLVAFVGFLISLPLVSRFHSDQAAILAQFLVTGKDLSKKSPRGRRQRAPGDLSARKSRISRGEGGRPARSRLTRRRSVAKSAA